MQRDNEQQDTTEGCSILHADPSLATQDDAADLGPASTMLEHSHIGKTDYAQFLNAFSGMANRVSCHLCFSVQLKREQREERLQNKSAKCFQLNRKKLFTWLL